MRIFTILIFSILIAFHAQAINCPYGQVFEGRFGGEFCVYTKRGMNWWSAYQWCASQGLHLATPSEACDYNDYSWKSMKCENLRGKRGSEGIGNIIWGWFNHIASSGKAYVVNLDNADVYPTEVSSDDRKVPLCVQ